ncbi:MAG: glycosyltransferase family 1 protein [Fimbriimonadaceae bacterium]|nr:glycosyltransferase family 1 protein [Fimbriimonadaceae bacterium]
MTPAPRVALFADTFDETNGVAHTYRTLAEYSEGRRLPLHVFCPGADGDQREDRGSVTIHRFRRTVGIQYYEGLFFDLLPNRRIADRFAESGPFDLVHLAAPGTLGGWGRRLAARHRLPSVGVHHTQLHDYAALRVPPALAKPARRFSLQVLRRFFSRCRLVFAPTPSMARFVTEAGLCRRSEVLGRGVDAGRFHPAHRTRPADSPVQILYVGRLSVEKNLEDLVSALNRTKQAKPAVEAVLVGDGPLRRSLEDRLPWARFTGMIRGEALARTYADSDIFFFPSRTDTFGNVVNEAMASGLPCLVMDRQGPGEVIREGETGRIADSPEEAARILEDWIDDPPLRRRLAENARALAESRTWDAVFSGLWDRYRWAAAGGVD